MWQIRQVWDFSTSTFLLVKGWNVMRLQKTSFSPLRLKTQCEKGCLCNGSFFLKSMVPIQIPLSFSISNQRRALPFPTINHNRTQKLLLPPQIEGLNQLPPEERQLSWGGWVSRSLAADTQTSLLLHVLSGSYCCTFQVDSFLFYFLMLGNPGPLWSEWSPSILTTLPPKDDTHSIHRPCIPARLISWYLECI